MPNRILREGILTSPRIAKLGWAEEVFYRRLHSVVDDFGRYFADPGLLRAACYPRQLSKVSDSDIGKWLAACDAAALVRVYPCESGEQYLQLLDFNQQVRAKKSKFPEPPGTCAASATQTPANAHLDVSVSGVVIGDVSVDVGEKTPRKRDVTPPIQRPDDVIEKTWGDWLQLRKSKRAPVTETVLDGARLEAGKAGITLQRFLEIWCMRGSQGLEAGWLRADERGPARNAPQSFAASDRDAGMARWEQMTGRTHPDRAGGAVIDMPDSPAPIRIAA